MEALLYHSPSRDIVLKQVMPEGVCLWSDVSSTTLKASGHGAMVQRGIGDIRGMVDSHRAEAMPGAAAASTKGLERTTRISSLKMARSFVGSDGFAVSMRCMLRVCWTVCVPPLVINDSVMPPVPI
jgi:hypothetical protein